MYHRVSFALCTSMLLWTFPSDAIAQDAPPSHVAAPDVYKLIFEDQDFRVILGTWKKGVRDKFHSHPAQRVGYRITDCALRIHTKDGKSRDASPKAGTAVGGQGRKVSAHSAENIGPGECRILFVEKK